MKVADLTPEVTKDPPVFLYKYNEPNGFMSNYFPGASFDFLGKDWKTAEHCFQANKFLDDESFFEIRAAKSPVKAV